MREFATPGRGTSEFTWTSQDFIVAATDRELLERAVAGDRDALEELLALVGPSVREAMSHQISRRWRSVLSADDVMQQAYIDAFLDIKHFEPRGTCSFESWLLTIARRNLIDAVRHLEADKRGRKIDPPPSTDGDAYLALYERLARTYSTPSQRVAREEKRAAVQRALGRLPPRYRMAIEMYRLNGRTIEEVAAALGCQVGAAHMVVRRAQDSMKKHLGNRDEYVSG